MELGTYDFILEYGKGEDTYRKTYDGKYKNLADAKVNHNYCGTIVEIIERISPAEATEVKAKKDAEEFAKREAVKVHKRRLVEEGDRVAALEALENNYLGVAVRILVANMD